MDWIDKRVAETDALAQESIRDFSPEVYAALWEEVISDVVAAKKYFPSLYTNGGPWSRIVKLPVPGQREPKQVLITLSKDKRSITATGVRIDIQFLLCIGSDGVVYLKHQDSAIAIPDAAKKIMDAFLFPELNN